MTTIIKRDCFLFNPEIMTHPWAPWPRNVAYGIRRFPTEPLELVTWEQVIESRRTHQAETLRRKRFNYQGIWRPVILDTRFYDIQFFGGWQCYIYGAGGIAHWVKYEHNGLMKLLPLREGLFPVEDWYNWKRVFAETFTNGKFCKRPRGRKIIWARVTGSGQWARFEQYALANPNRRNRYVES